MDENYDREKGRSWKKEISSFRVAFLVGVREESDEGRSLGKSEREQFKRTEFNTASFRELLLIVSSLLVSSKVKFYACHGSWRKKKAEYTRCCYEH